MNTTNFINRIMGNLFKTQTNPALPTSFYLGFSTTTPSAAGGNVTEPSGNGYSRKQLSTSVLSTPSNGVVNNKAEIVFSESTASWGTLTHYVVYDTATGGNLLFYGALSSSITVDAQSTITIPTGNLVITLSDS